MSINALSRMLRGVCLGSLLAFLIGCSSSFSPQDEKDLALVGAACKALKESEKQIACVDAAVRLTASKVPDTAIPKMPPPSGKAREEITFKGIQFDQPGRMNDVLGLCDKHPDVPIKQKSNPLERNVEVGCLLAFGSKYTTYAEFSVSESGSLLGVKTSGPPEYMQSLIDLMTEKYGHPLIENIDVQSRSGTKYESKIAKWTDLHGTQIVVRTRAQEYPGADQFFNSREFGRIYRPESLRLTFGGEVVIESATGAKANAEHQRQILEKSVKGI